MSIRKVSDLEPLSFQDPTQDQADLSNALIEVSMPQHDDGGHAFKSMFTTYGSMRMDVLSTILSSSGETVFINPVSFTSSVYMYDGASISGNLSVNVDNPDWADQTIYMRAGDITLSSQNNTNIFSSGRVNLSAPDIYSYASTFHFNDYNSPTNAIATVTKNSINLKKTLTCDTDVRVPTRAFDSDQNNAVNIAMLQEKITELEEYVRTQLEQYETDFKLIDTRIFNENDITNNKFLLAKYYARDMYDDQGNKIGTENFVEYDIKTKPYQDATDKDLIFPDILNNQTLSMVATETTNMTSTKDSKVQTTSLKLIPLASTATYADYIVGVNLTNVAKTESANIHVFAQITNFAPEAGRMIFPAGTTTPFNFNSRSEIRGKELFTFSTPCFSTQGRYKFMIRVSGKLNLINVSNYINIEMYAYATDRDGLTDNVCLYSGITGTAYPQKERLLPCDKKTASIVDVESATNGYFKRTSMSKGVNKYQAKNAEQYAYQKRYAYVYKNVEDGAGCVKNVQNKTASINTYYYKSIGTEKVYADAKSFQFTKTFNFSKSYASKIKSMRIVFAIPEAKQVEKMSVVEDFNVQLLHLEA